MLQCSIQYTGNYARHFLFVMCRKFTAFPNITLFHGSTFHIRLELLHSYINSPQMAPLSALSETNLLTSCLVTVLYHAIQWIKKSDSFTPPAQVCLRQAILGSPSYPPHINTTLFIAEPCITGWNGKLYLAVFSSPTVNCQLTLQQGL
jgi:hypothetical protein